MGLMVYRICATFGRTHSAEDRLMFADSDDEALAMASKMMRGPEQAEVWQSNRLVGRVAMWTATAEIGPQRFTRYAG